MRLYFVRHGKAEQSAASDEQRQLTAEGQARLATEAQVIARLGIHPQVIYSSPRIRAQQTAQIIAQALGMTITVQEALDYGFNRDSVAALIRDLDASAELMFVGHNPTLPQVVHSLTGSSIEMKTGSLARVDVLSASELHGILVWLIAPKVFDALAG